MIPLLKTFSVRNTFWTTLLVCFHTFVASFLVWWTDLSINYLFIWTFSGTYQKPYVALIDGITMGGVSIYLKLSSCCTSTPADGAVCSDLAEYVIKGVNRQCGPACLCVYKINKKWMNDKVSCFALTIHIAVPLFSQCHCEFVQNSRTHFAIGPLQSLEPHTSLRLLLFLPLWTNAWKILITITRIIIWLLYVFLVQFSISCSHVWHYELQESCDALRVINPSFNPLHFYPALCILSSRFQQWAAFANNLWVSFESVLKCILICRLVYWFSLGLSNMLSMLHIIHVGLNSINLSS